jgi:hypothetical protein
VCHANRYQKDWRQTTLSILSLPQKPTAIDSTGVGDPIGEDLCRKRDDVELFIFTQRSKQQLLEGLAMAIQKREITFPEEYAHELEQMEFVYTRTGVIYSVPEGETDDRIMSLALARRKWEAIITSLGGTSVW